MKMDKQHRLTIPKFVRDSIGIKEGEYYYFNYEENSNFSIRKIRGGKIIDKIKIDGKGRFCVPSSIYEVLDSKEIIMYAEDENGQIGISILKEDT